MFIKYGFNIRKNDLRLFFKQIDENQDDNLNWTEFKNALKNKEALASKPFSSEIYSLRRDHEENQSGKGRAFVKEIGS